MYRISQLASRVGLSRSTLLYYEKLGLIQSRRSSNGYRYFTEADRQRLTLVQQLQAGGLTLKECKASIDSQLDRALLKKRLETLDDDIAAKLKARKLLASLLGEDNDSLSHWHETLENTAPEAHRQWLKQQGFSDRDAHHIKWLSRNMNENEQYMEDFFKIFRGLEHWGPGSKEVSLKALQELKASPSNILDIGCGPGSVSLMLAEQTQANIVALDNDARVLEFLRHRAETLGCAEKIEPCCASMMDIPFAPQSFDLLWCETSVYIMGFVKALKEWHKFLADDGYLVVSDLAWVNDNPLAKLKTFWGNGYPDMTSLAERVQQAEENGYSVVSHFAYGNDAWQNYAKPLLARTEELSESMPESRAIADLREELATYDLQPGQFDYIMMILKKK